MKARRFPGSAHTGTLEWLLQRVTALYLSGFVVYLVLTFSFAPLRDYLAWKTWFSQGPVRVAWALFFASLLLHAWIGLRSVYMDYLHTMWIRFSVSLATAFGLLSLALWAVQILLQVTA
jgi:succinate dehydrogenase / fumarate reductase, membrane anchor subunit